MKAIKQEGVGLLMGLLALPNARRSINNSTFNRSQYHKLGGWQQPCLTPAQTKVWVRCQPVFVAMVVRARLRKPLQPISCGAEQADAPMPVIHASTGR
jgi:hypothetical protein